MVSAVHLSEQVAFQRSVLGTAKGSWLIYVNSVLAANDSDNASLQLVLTKVSDEAGSESRRLYLVVPASYLEVPQDRVAITHRIRRWIETTRGNGFLDLVKQTRVPGAHVADSSIARAQVPAKGELNG